MAGGPDPNDSFSPGVGYILVFNLIVGTGALSLPKAFRHAGYILAIVLLIVSFFTSYVCATFLLEGMAVANAAIRSDQLKNRKKSDRNPPSKEEIAAIYRIDNRTEVSAMAMVFLGKYGVLFLMLIMTIYLFGDLAIYTVTVPKSIMNVMCSTDANAEVVSWDEPCWANWPKWTTRSAIYRIWVAVFVLFVTPLVIIGVRRTKYLQISTSVCRWTAFILMIVLASILLGDKGSPSIPQPVIVNGFGSLFGTTVYAFMCHHSLPSLITPMKTKKHLMFFLLLVYLCVLLFYVALSTTGAFAFVDIYDVYSLNFLHSPYFQTIFYKICDYFLALFPVFTITTNYPIVGCTLINNLLVAFDICEEMLAERGITFFRSNKVANATSDPPPIKCETLAERGITFFRTNKVANATSDPPPIKCETGEQEHENKTAIDVQKEKDNKERIGEEPTENGSMKGNDVEKGDKDKDSSDNETEEERIRRKTLEHEDRIRKETLTEVPVAKPRPLRRYIVMVVLIGLATLIAMLTDNVLILAEITGSYPGVGVQYIIPSLIVIFARRYSLRELGSPVPSCSASPFSHTFWPYLLLLWSVFAIVMVSLNFADVFE
uniref:Amino acid transporter transmembrane domain-containing protein n=1 Tax=Ascaris lumbricoides TaxID=6252 RepID=A0A9J2Q4I9_ASCLU